MLAVQRGMSVRGRSQLKELNSEKFAVLFGYEKNVRSTDPRMTSISELWTEEIDLRGQSLISSSGHQKSFPDKPSSNWGKRGAISCGDYAVGGTRADRE